MRTRRAMSRCRSTSFITKPRRIRRGKLLRASQELRRCRRSASLLHLGHESAGLIGAYALYEGGQYGEAVIMLDRFIQLHSDTRDIAYAYYLKAMCYYVQVIDVRRDQKNTETRHGGTRRGCPPLLRQQVCALVPRLLLIIIPLFA